jgi:hypothetical protein
VNQTSTIFIAIAAMMAILNWVAVARGAKSLEYLSKPAATVAFLLTAGFLDVPHDAPWGWMLAALLFTLLVVAVGLTLSAAESRDERDVLVAVGAKPATLRRVAGQKAAMMALAGTALSVPTGLVPVIMVLRPLRQAPGELPLDIPWLVIGMLVVSVPIVAGVVTWGSSVIAQRVRPVRMSTLALD